MNTTLQLMKNQNVNSVLFNNINFVEQFLLGQQNYNFLRQPYSANLVADTSSRINTFFLMLYNNFNFV
jgi:hypothetical protein